MCKLTSKWFVLAVIGLFSIGEGLADERYRVASGDNLYRIGKRFGIDYREIMTANRLRKTTIFPDQILIIPSNSRPPVAIAQKSAPRIPPAQTYAANPQVGNSSSYGNSTVPRDPVKPFVSAKRLPTAPPLASEEDPLGLGYNPNPAPSPPVQKARPVPTQRVQTPVTPQSPQIARAPEPKTFRRTREVPAVAHYPGKTNGSFTLDPKHFPMPSFKNPCKPCPIKTARRSPRSGSRTYTVQGGDSVLSISRKFGVSPFKLRHTNKIVFSKLRPGMSLAIPESRGIWSL